jgi:hypothetical protein
MMVRCARQAGQRPDERIEALRPGLSRLSRDLGPEEHHVVGVLVLHHHALHEARRPPRQAPADHGLQRLLAGDHGLDRLQQRARDAGHVLDHAKELGAWGAPRTRPSGDSDASPPTSTRHSGHRCCKEAGLS